MTQVLQNRTRRSLRPGDRFALDRNPGLLRAYWQPTFGVGERWHIVETIHKHRQAIGNHLVYKVKCSSCGSVGKIYDDARMTIRRDQT